MSLILALACGLQGQVSSSYDFGSVEIGGTGSATTVTFQLPQPQSPILTIQFGTDFVTSGLNCSSTTPMTCSLNVVFSPIRPGLRQDALIVTDANDNQLRIALLHGVGLAPQSATQPGELSPFAGTGVGSYGPDGIAASQSALYYPQGICVDMAGNVFIADSLNQVIRKVSSADGKIRTVAGTGSAGIDRDGLAADASRLNTPVGVAVDPGGNLLIADNGNNRIAKVDALTGNLNTVAGLGSPSGGDNLGDGGPATNAVLNGPTSIVIDSVGTIYIADSFDNLVRKIDPTSGVISIVAGVVGAGGSTGNDGLGDGGPAASAMLSNPEGLALDASGGNLYIADNGNNLIRVVNLTSQIITTVAGSLSGSPGDNIPATSASLVGPQGIRVDAAGNLYIAEFGNNKVREVDSRSELITTLAGTGNDSGYNPGTQNPLQADFGNVSDVALDAQGRVYIADYNHNVVRRIDRAAQSLSFDTTPVGLISPSQSATFLNIGNQPLQLTQLGFTGDFSQIQSSQLNCASSLALAAGDRCTAAVVFRPTATGTRNGTLYANDNNLNQLGAVQTVSLSGLGTNSTAPVTINPTTVTFGYQNLNISSIAQTITITNTGATALTITGITISGPNAVDFAFAANQCSSTVAISYSCSVSVIFVPTAVGARSATVNIVDSATNSPQSVVLSGTGVIQLSSAPSAVIFSNQSIGSTSASQTISITNTGATPLTIDNILIEGANVADFSIVTNQCIATTLPVSGTCTVSVDFAPTQPGQRVASLIFVSNSSHLIQQIPMSGEVTPASVIIEPESLSFGGQAIGTTNTGQQLTLTNSSGQEVSTPQVTIVGPAAEEYVLTNDCDTTIRSRETCRLSVSFQPMGLGNRPASLQVVNSSGLIEYCPLSGTGEIVPNFGFESGSLSPWSAVINDGSASVSEVSHSGSYGLALGPNNGSELVYQDVTNLMPGQTYLITVWVKGSSENNGGAQLVLDDTSGTNLAYSDVTSPGQVWQQISVPYSVTANGSVRIHLYELPTVAYTYWDDVEVLPIPPSNGGFETGLLSPWIAPVTGGTSVVSTTAHTGTRCLSIGATTSLTGVYQDVTGLTPGQLYVVSVWVKSSGASGGGQYIAVDDTQGNNEASSSTMPPSTNWQQISVPYVVSNNGSLRIHLEALPGSTSTYWDDILVVPLPPVNGGFESGSVSPWLSTFPDENVGVDTIAHSGSYSLRIGAANGPGMTYQDLAGLIPGQNYVVSAWVRASGAGASQVQMEVHDTLGNGYVSSSEMTPGTAWQQITLSFSATSNGLLRIGLFQLEGTGFTYWDDVQVTTAAGVYPWSGATTNPEAGSGTDQIASAVSGSSAGNTISEQTTPAVSTTSSNQQNTMTSGISSISAPDPQPGTLASAVSTSFASQSNERTPAITSRSSAANNSEVNLLSSLRSLVVKAPFASAEQLVQLDSVFLATQRDSGKVSEAPEATRLLPSAALPNPPYQASEGVWTSDTRVSVIDSNGIASQDIADTAVPISSATIEPERMKPFAAVASDQNSSLRHDQAQLSSANLKAATLAGQRLTGSRQNLTSIGKQGSTRNGSGIAPDRASHVKSNVRGKARTLAHSVRLKHPHREGQRLDCRQPVSDTLN